MLGAASRVKPTSALFGRTPRKYVGKQISLREIRPFVFAPIALTDDATKAVRDEAIIKGLGTIRLDVYRVTYKGTVENTDQYMDESTEQVRQYVSRAFERKLINPDQS